MAKSPSPLWLQTSPELESMLRSSVERGVSEAPQGRAKVFFRADDIGVPGKQFERLMALFARRKVSLALAVVPTWLTTARWQTIRKMGAQAPELFCWHHHGWRHMNHEKTGKKQEFGDARPKEAVKKEIESGKKRLGSIMGDDFYPLFTPPWNRCSTSTMDSLWDLGYKAISRSRNSKPPAPSGLPDIQVNVDLHTRKEADPETSWRALLDELEKGLSSGLCGIMIHHQLMNESAFSFLDLLLAELSANRRTEIVTIKELAES